ncbi:MAG: hypothetical protein JWM95_5406 [Gemmatimonadetes bacterium]|nr:hypothetical protein [Gemmatimonadota bacterium]
MGALVLAGACKDKPAPATADSSLATDLAMAQRSAPAPTVFNDAPVNATAQQPRPEPRRDTSPAPRPTPRRNAPPVQAPVVRTPRQAPPEPVATAPTPVPAPATVAPAPAAGIIGAGSRVGMTTNAKVCANTLLVGDKLSASVSSGVTGSNGASIPPGATVVLEVASVDKGDPIESSRITFRVRSVDVNGQSQPATGDVANNTPLQRVGDTGTSDRNKVIGGAVAGAVLGKIFGKSTKATVIGGAAGAAAGAAAASRSAPADACLPAGSALSLTINRDIVAKS